MEQDFLEQAQGREIDLIVCSDAEQILGIGDQGVGVSRVAHNFFDTSYPLCLQGIGVSV